MSSRAKHVGLLDGTIRRKIGQKISQLNWDNHMDNRCNELRFRTKGGSGVEVAATTETKEQYIDIYDGTRAKALAEREKQDLLAARTSKNAKKASDFERLRNAPEEHVCCAEGAPVTLCDIFFQHRQRSPANRLNRVRVQ
ncbi:hypothetical protein Tco_0751338, partial [Tanacetum coccineum]